MKKLKTASCWIMGIGFLANGQAHTPAGGLICCSVIIAGAGLYFYARRKVLAVTPVVATAKT